MIIYHQNNVAAFAGNHVYYWVGQPIIQAYRISATSAAPTEVLISQARSLSRFVFSRMFGRVN